MMNVVGAVRVGRRMMRSALPTAAMALAVSLTGPASAGAAGFDIVHFDGNVLQADGDPATQAGSHPDTASTTFSLATTTAPSGITFPTEDLKDATAQLPPGLIGNPQAVGECTAAELGTENGAACPVNSQIGIATVHRSGILSGDLYVPLFNVVPPDGFPAAIGFNFANTTIQLTAKLRTGGDYGVTVFSRNTPTTITFSGFDVQVWGTPGDPKWDPLRSLACLNTSTGGPLGAAECPKSSNLPPVPFFTLPTACLGPQETTLAATGWEGGADSASFLSHDNSVPPVPIGADGCETVPFDPSFSARSETANAEEATGLDFTLNVPQQGLLEADGTATANLRKAVVTLPEGMTVNPSSADGLEACAPQEVGLGTEEPARCPPAAKIADVEVVTPLLDHPVPGGVYLASQSSFQDSLIALYIAIHDPVTGVVVKLPGKVEVGGQDGVSGLAPGQLRAVFDNQPQLPFDSVRLRFKGGPRGPLSTPPACGTYTTQAEFYGWAGNPPAIRQDSFTIDRGPDGGPCRPAPPFNPRMIAGVQSPVAGGSSPFLLNLLRDDGEQEIDGLAMDLPPGLLARLKGVARCPDSVLESISPLAGTGAAQHAAPSCPAESQVGTVVAGAGAGPNPFYARTGRLYLAGPYKGAPLSLAAVVPALAGPFDLGTVVVRNRVLVDSDDAQVHVISEPLPTMLFGIPLKLRDIRVNTDRPDFMRSPTNCEPKSVDAVLHSSLGAVARPSNRFQVGDCGSLRFKPRFKFLLKGGIRRGKFPALRSVVAARSDEAAFARVSVALPRSEFLEQAHIRTVCTRVQFAVDQCPQGSIYGRARVITPLLNEPLVGPAYLRSSDNELPDLVLALRGPESLPIAVNLVGRIDSFRGGIRTTFEAPPDAPVSRVVLDMQGGKKGLLVNSRNICKSISRATVRVRGQHGRTFSSRPAMKPKCRRQKKTQQKREASNEVEKNT